MPERMPRQGDPTGSMMTATRRRWGVERRGFGWRAGRVMSGGLGTEFATLHYRTLRISKLRLRISRIEMLDHAAFAVASYVTSDRRLLEFRARCSCVMTR